MSESVERTIGALVMFPESVTQRIKAKAINVATSFTTVLIGMLFPFLFLVFAKNVAVLSATTVLL